MSSILGPFSALRLWAEQVPFLCYGFGYMYVGIIFTSRNPHAADLVPCKIFILSFIDQILTWKT